MKRAIYLPLIALVLGSAFLLEGGYVLAGKQSRIQRQMDNVKVSLHEFSVLRQELEKMSAVMPDQERIGMNAIFQMIDETMDDLLALRSMVMMSDASLDRTQTDKLVLFWIEDVYEESQVNMHVLDSMVEMKFGYQVRYAVQKNKEIIRQLTPSLKKLQQLYGHA